MNRKCSCKKGMQFFTFSEAPTAGMSLVIRIIFASKFIFLVSFSAGVSWAAPSPEDTYKQVNLSNTESHDASAVGGKQALCEASYPRGAAWTDTQHTALFSM